MTSVVHATVTNPDWFGRSRGGCAADDARATKRRTGDASQWILDWEAQR
jgi:hypothetical protein